MIRQRVIKEGDGGKQTGGERESKGISEQVSELVLI